jgi:predicted transcriptional regulator
MNDEAVQTAGDESGKLQSRQKELDYEQYVRQAIERGLADSDAGRTMSIEDVRSRFGLKP